MAKIVFIQRLLYEYPGVESLAAILKKGGHDVRIIIEERPHKIVKRLSMGEIAAFSVMTGTHHWALNVALAIKDKLGLLTVFGGPHPTFFPELINNDGVDVICRGEGEYALLDLANAIDSKSNFTGIKNLWVKKDRVIYRNPLRPLINNLDSLPFQDRRLYYDSYPFLKNNSHKIFLAGRGCPFECAFCFNEKLKGMYNGLGQYVRLRAPSNIVEEIRQVKKEYFFKTVFFNDDILVLNHDWLKELLPLYKKEIGLPFYAAARADTLHEDIVELLRDSGCKGVSFAIESGNEVVRNNILCKKITNRQIVDSAALLKKYGIRFATYNMLGIPGETVEDAFETISLNVKIRTDYPRCSFLTPYPGTKIAEFAKNNNYMEKTPDSISALSQQSGSIIRLENKNKIINLHSFFQTAVLFPGSIPLIRKLIKLPPNQIFSLWWMITYFIIFNKSEGRNFREMLFFAMRSSGSFIADRTDYR